MTKYIVLPKRFFGAYNQYQPGDIVDISPADAAAFLDKLAPYEEEAPEAEGDFGTLSDRIILALVEEGITPDAIPLMTDEELLSVNGVGEGSVTEIRAQYPYQE